MFNIGDRVVWNGISVGTIITGSINYDGRYAGIRLDNGAIGTVATSKLVKLA
jgi:hypothetical protein